MQTHTHAWSLAGLVIVLTAAGCDRGGLRQSGPDMISSPVRPGHWVQNEKLRSLMALLAVHTGQAEPNATSPTAPGAQRDPTSSNAPGAERNTKSSSAPAATPNTTSSNAPSAKPDPTAEDFDRIATAARALAEAADAIPDLLAGVDLSQADRRAFAAQATTLHDQAARLEQTARRRQSAKSRVIMNEILGTCTACHLRFRDLSGLLNPIQKARRPNGSNGAA